MSGSSIGQDDEDTGACLLAYLASVESIFKSVEDEEPDGPYERGRALIQRLALSANAKGDPTLSVTVNECADILHFIGSSTPIAARGNWWDDPDERPSHVVGFLIALDVVERKLRELGKLS
jgi:hypothetical protein